MRCWVHIVMVLLVVAGLLPGQVKAQAESNEATTATAISEETYRAIVKDYRYDKTKTVWRPKRKKKKQAAQADPGLSSGLAEGIGGVLRLLGYVLLGALILTLIYVAVKQIKPPEKKASAINLDQIERIEEVDLDSLLAEALAQQDYRLSFRIRFLLVLQQLTKAKKVRYRPYKTNRAYTKELVGLAEEHPFRQLSHSFEYVWYGQHEVSATEYQQLDSLFRPFDHLKVAASRV